MKNEFGFEKENFDRVAENALNGIDPASLSAEEMQAHRQWVAANWDELNSGLED